jgi:anti-sigma factor RsiW
MNDPDDDDLLLVALLDGVMDESEASQMRRRLDDDPALRDKLDRLRRIEPQLRAAFDFLLADAPLSRLRARLAAPPPARTRAWRAAAAVAAAGLIFAGGFAAARWTASADDWRNSVAEYMELYAPETFGGADTPAPRRDLAALGDRLGLALDYDLLSVAGLVPRRVETLRYDGAPLGQVGYLDGAIPIAFCIMRDGEKDAPLALGSHEDFATASWAKGGRGFMVIGQAPRDRIAALARALQERI